MAAPRRFDPLALLSNSWTWRRSSGKTPPGDVLSNPGPGVPVGHHGGLYLAKSAHIGGINFTPKGRALEGREPPNARAMRGS